MTDRWEPVREAIAAKFAASSGMATAGLRSASIDVDDIGDPPFIRILPCSFDPIGADGDVEEYTLVFPWELVVAQPSGRTRSDPTGQAIVRAMQEEMRTGVTLGLSGAGCVVDSRMGPASPGLQEYEFTGQNGYRGTITVQMYEPASRTA